jgi:hypothetical protein
MSIYRIKAVDSLDREPWVVFNSRKDNWHWGVESGASTLRLREAENLIHEINVRNRYLDSDERMTPCLVKER